MLASDINRIGIFRIVFAMSIRFTFRWIFRTFRTKETIFFVTFWRIPPITSCTKIGVIAFVVAAELTTFLANLFLARSHAIDSLKIHSLIILVNILHHRTMSRIGFPFFSCSEAYQRMFFTISCCETSGRSLICHP